MTRGESSLDKMIKDAERQGAELQKLEEKNRRRRAKGRKPLPDLQDALDMQVLQKKYRTNDPTAVASEDAMKLFEIRKAKMNAVLDDDDESDLLDQGGDDEPARHGTSGSGPVVDSGKNASGKSPDPASERAIRQAAAARRAQDLKNGRIDHDGNWSDGQKLAGGDETVLPTADSVWKDVLPASEGPEHQQRPQQQPPQQPQPKPKLQGSQAGVPSDGSAFAALEAFKADLYARLRVSFDGIEKSLSEIIGKVAETAQPLSSVPPEPEAGEAAPGASEFEAMMNQKTPVVFDVAGTQMTFDAVCVFHATPCITVVSRIGSAKVTPKPGARLFLTYEMDGKTYRRDPVTYLGTRFDLPMFGLSFVGFIRDSEAGVMDADAGISGGEENARQGY